MLPVINYRKYYSQIKGPWLSSGRDSGRLASSTLRVGRDAPGHGFDNPFEVMESPRGSDHDLAADGMPQGRGQMRFRRGEVCNARRSLRYILARR